MFSNKTRFYAALKEACTDTGIAGAINIPMNYILVYLCIEVWLLSAVMTSTVMITIFTIYAIIRKTIIRMYFDAKQSKISSQLS